MQYYDLHTHTTWSDGQASIEYLLAAARRKGYKLGISDHLFCGGELDTPPGIQKYLNALGKYDVFKGCEANIGEDYALPDGLMARFDYVIASVHAIPDLAGGIIRLSQYFGERAGDGVIWARNIDESRSEQYLEAVLPHIEKTMRTQRMDIYGHATVLPFCEILAGTPFIFDWENRILALCKTYGIALEISGLWKDPSLAMVRRAHALGVKFSLGSDCHPLANACEMDYAIHIAQTVNLTPNDFFIPKLCTT